MGPTVFREKAYRFYFFPREETRMRVHVMGSTGEAKFWLQPEIELAQASGVTRQELNGLHKIVEEHRDELSNHWHRHFGG